MTEGATASVDAGSSSFTGKYAAETSGYVTFYEGAESSSVAYYVPEIESGWYHCAVSEPKYSELPAGTAVELCANGKTVHLLVTDLCPSSSNSNHTGKSDYFFDLEKSAFTYLADESVGVLNMTFKTVPYPTDKNIKIQVKDGVNEWWLAFRFYNMRYPLQKVEFSTDGNSFSEVAAMSGIDNNWFKVGADSGGLLSGAHYFRLTDVYGHCIRTSNLGAFSENGTFNLGKNFDY